MTNQAREVGGAFIAPQGNLAVGVSEIRTCPGWGLDMSDNCLWNPAWGPDMFDLRDLTQDKAERPNISGLGSEYVWDNSLKPR
jgi:hypothetical protein